MKTLLTSNALDPAAIADFTLHLVQISRKEAHGLFTGKTVEAYCMTRKGGTWNAALGAHYAQGFVGLGVGMLYRLPNGERLIWTCGPCIYEIRVCA